MSTTERGAALVVGAGVTSSASLSTSGCADVYFPVSVGYHILAHVFETLYLLSPSLLFGKLSLLISDNISTSSYSCLIKLTKVSDK